MKPRHRLLRTPARRALATLAALVVLWIATDFVHSRVVASRLARWEASHERGADGVQAGHHAYTVGNGETALLLVHGIGDSPRAFERMAPRLAELGFTCRVMRLPGFAEPVEALARTGHGDWIRAVDAELAALRRGRARVAIVAHSLGAAVSIAQQLERPGSADALVLLAPLLEVSDRRSPLLPPRAWHTFSRRALLFTSVTETPFPIDARDPDERERPDRFRFTPTETFGEVFALLDRIRARSNELKLPLMTVVSANDRVTDRSAAERFHEGAGSSPKVLRVAADAAHALPRDHGWEALTLEIAEFVRVTTP